MLYIMIYSKAKDLTAIGARWRAEAKPPEPKYGSIKYGGHAGWQYWSGQWSRLVENETSGLIIGPTEPHKVESNTSRDKVLPPAPPRHGTIRSTILPGWLRMTHWMDLSGQVSHTLHAYICILQAETRIAGYSRYTSLSNYLSDCPSPKNERRAWTSSVTGGLWLE